MPTTQDITLPDVHTDQATEFAPRYRVLIHNDNITTFEYVMKILGSIFLLSQEIAEHIAWTAHAQGVAVVIVRPAGEATKLAKAANNRARMDGYPLAFSTELDP